MQWFFKLLSKLPLACLRGIGGAVGTLVFRSSKKMQRITKENLCGAGFFNSEVYANSGREAGIQSLESIWVWYRPRDEVLTHVEVSDRAMKLIGDAMRDSSVPVVFMTPHIGCFEVLPVWLSRTFFKETGRNITVLFRPPKNALLRKIVGEARQTPGVEAVPTTISGVKKVIKNLRRGHTFGALPDQVPSGGEGVWADFFGRPAYTMTLAVRVSDQFNARRIFAWGKRTEFGWQLDAVEWNDELSGCLEKDVLAMNRRIEEIIGMFPEQYAWSYNRYKCPRGVERPSTE